MADDAALERITILLQARDRDFARAMDRNNKLVAKFAREAEQNTRRMSAEVESNLRRATDAAMGFGRSFAAGIAGGAVATLLGSVNTNIGGTIKAIAQVGDEARRSGLDLQTFQEWKFVAEQNRIGVDQLVDGFKELALRADEFVVTGGGSAAEAFDRLGFSASDLKRRMEDPSDLMLEIIRRLGAMDKAAQIRIADEVFGGSAGERFVELLEQGADALDRTIDRAHGVGAVMDSEMIAKADQLDRKFGEVAATVEGLFKRAVVGAFGAGEAYLKLREENRELFNSVERAIPLYGALGLAIDTIGEATGPEKARSQIEEFEEDLDQSVSAVIDKAEELGAGLAQVTRGLALAGNSEAAQQINEIVSAIERAIAEFDREAISAEQLAARIAEANTAAIDAYASLSDVDKVGMSSIISQIGSLSQALLTAIGNARTLRSNLPGGPSAIAAFIGEDSKADQIAARNIYDWRPDAGVPAVRPPEAPSELSIPDPPRPGKGGRGGKGKRDSLAGQMEATRAEIAELEAEAAVLIAVAAGNQQLGDAMEYARKKAELLAAAQKEGKAITPELRAEIDQLAMSYMTAGLSAEEAADRIDRIKEASEQGIDMLTDMFDEIILGGGDAKKALASLFAEMARVQFRNALVGAASSGGGGIFGLLGSLLVPRRAGGGSVEAGRPYLVNENTPNSELFVPSQSGAVLNIPQAQAAMRPAGQQAPRVVYVPQPYVASVSADDDGRIIGTMRRIAAATTAVGMAEQQRALPGSIRDAQARGLR